MALKQQKRTTVQAEGWWEAETLWYDMDYCILGRAGGAVFLE